MVKIKMFLAEYCDELERVVNQWIESNRVNDIVDFRYQRDPRCISQYSVCLIYKED